MSTARARVQVPGHVADVEALWYDLTRWPGWIDGFSAVHKLQGDWPRTGGELVWDSKPAGRGRVVERATRYEPRVGQVSDVEDEKLTGTQRIAFAAREDDQVVIELELRYRLKSGGPVMFVADLAFIRRALRDSLRRTLDRFAREYAMERELAATGH